jgi:hypothetical protein
MLGYLIFLYLMVGLGCALMMYLERSRSGNDYTVEECLAAVFTWPKFLLGKPAKKLDYYLICMKHGQQVDYFNVRASSIQKAVEIIKQSPDYKIAERPVTFVNHTL